MRGWVMERIDLQEPRFTQAQVLTILRILKEKTLQNWVSRGLIEPGNLNPGRQGKRLYSAADVISLEFMTKATALGIPPSAAKQMTKVVVERAIELHETYDAKEVDGQLRWT